MTNLFTSGCSQEEEEITTKTIYQEIEVRRDEERDVLHDIVVVSEIDILSLHTGDHLKFRVRGTRTSSRPSTEYIKTVKSRWQPKLNTSGPLINIPKPRTGKCRVKYLDEISPYTEEVDLIKDDHDFYIKINDQIIEVDDIRRENDEYFIDVLVTADMLSENGNNILSVGVEQNDSNEYIKVGFQGYEFPCDGLGELFFWIDGSTKSELKIMGIREEYTVSMTLNY